MISLRNRSRGNWRNPRAFHRLLLLFLCGLSSECWPTFRWWIIPPFQDETTLMLNSPFLQQVVSAQCFLPQRIRSSSLAISLFSEYPVFPILFHPAYRLPLLKRVSEFYYVGQPSVRNDWSPQSYAPSADELVAGGSKSSSPLPCLDFSYMVCISNGNSNPFNRTWASYNPCWVSSMFCREHTDGN